MKTRFCYQTNSSCSCGGWKLGNNKLIWKLGWETGIAVSRFSSKRGVRECAGKESDDQEGAPQIVTNTDTAAYLGCSLGLTMPSVLRSGCAV